MACSMRRVAIGPPCLPTMTPVTTPAGEVGDIELLGPVRSVLGEPSAQLLDWGARILHGGLGGISTLYRFSGRAEAAGTTTEWSLVLKAIAANQRETGE